TIILTTHYLEEAQEMCDEIAIINHGAVVTQDSTANLLGRLDSKTLVITPASAASLPPLPAGITGQHHADGRLSFTYSASATPADRILDLVRAAGISIKDVQSREADLEDVFLSLTS
ncbi:MAG: ABC transporter ATP-binding protein, partial [Loktanella sp.]|nr:ABC transporter ATP-binding protein [Loktanella sp.]